MMTPERKLYASYVAAGYAITYLRKLKQWNAGKINLQVEGCDPPHRMSDELIAEELELMLQLRDDNTV